MTIKSESAAISTRTYGDSPLSLTLDGRIAQMRRMVAGMQPGSAAQALRALRDAFPDVPLDERVRVVADRRH